VKGNVIKLRIFVIPTKEESHQTS